MIYNNFTFARFEMPNISIPKSLDKFMEMDRKEQVVVGGIAGASAIMGVIAVNKLFGTNPIGRTYELFGKFFVQEGKRKIEVNEMIEGYNNLHNDDTAGLDGRNDSYTTLVNAYYELATLFYEWGWGQSFHFAYQLPWESFQTAIARHEYYLAGRLGVKQGDKVLDCGCGVGGPMRNIARFTRANITGVTLNEVCMQHTPTRCEYISL
jgi:sterol 24-C-methyltransferase